MPLTRPQELDAALDEAAAQEAWQQLPAETQAALIAFIKDGWLRRTRSRRAATVAALCAEGPEAVATWQAGNARLTRAARSVNRSSGMTMN
jgi:uncharacterized protein YdeI (YjbR/CyaY-like superfamily)